MLLPDKHISFAESLLGLGSFIIEQLDTPQTIDNLWQKFEKVRDSQYPAYHSFDNLVLATDILFAINLIHENANGHLEKSNVTRQSCALSA